VRRCCWSDEAVRNVLAYEPERRSGLLDLSGRPNLQGYENGVRPARLYHQLLQEEALS